ncbi:hypothetical protein NBRC10513v2_001176 [Rhodotorula toruloides]|uniref:DnaJ homologue subfamily C member 28 conserved domain-containing protein n=2 Tax=Rhodotorula toruloides TaxID=5286 RepID=A0A2T0A5R2_RHOTO|nr:hypothetical protein AAT19DRAFT_16063 [Rhodotorula toruloides]
MHHTRTLVARPFAGPATRAFSATATSRSTSRPSSSAAAFIAAQAEAEEQRENEEDGRARKREPVVPDPEAWTGEETRERMLKRILEDQYKPLRVKGYKKAIPKPAPLPSQAFESSPTSASSSASSSTPDVDPEAIPTRTLMPWEVEFKAPNHYNPLPGYRPSPSSTSTSTALIGAGLSAKKAALAAARKDAALLSSRPTAARKQRLASAYERSLDYRGGVRPSGAQNGSFSGRGIAVPVHVDESGGVGHSGEMRVWEGFIEEKIKQARRAGVFDNVKGRGKPMPKDEAESNPFITRTEFLMNRILKEQEAAPPWVEMQKELETALANFRSELRASWTRRAVRIRSSEGLTQAVVREIREGWKDREWEERERAYHEVSIKSLNDLTRKYNIIAPYNVRRTLLSLRHELDAAITSCAPSIAAELQRRIDSGMSSPSPGVIYTDTGKVQSMTADEMGGEKKADKKDTMWKAFKRVLVEVLSKGPDPEPAQVGQARRQ